MSAAKKSPSTSSAPDLSIVGDQVTIHSGPSEPSRRVHHETHDRNLVEHMARFRESPLDFLREISLHVSGTGWRSYDNVVGQPLYYAGFTENMKAAIMGRPMLRAKIAELAEGRAQVEVEMGLLPVGDPLFEKKRARRKAVIEENLKELVERWTDEMVCKMENKTFIRGAYYLATQLLTRAYHLGIHVSSEEILKLRSVAEKAAKDGQSIIFLPCHRSHVDYVSLQLICYRLGLALPTVVAGDNLNFPLVGPFLQHAGAMWIRRSFGDDALYITLVQAYIDTLLTKGYNFECFIEGGRSRMGKLLPPKFGILSFLLDSVLSGRVKDAIIYPVSTQYDKVLEVDSYISELLGTPKQKENLRDFLSASSVLSMKLGRVDVRFHEPWSLRGFIDEQQARFQSLSTGQQADLQKSHDSNLRTRLLRTLGYRVLADINDASVVMPTSLIGTVLLTLRGRGVGKTELIRRVEWLSDRVRAQGGRVAHFAGLPTATVVERTLDVLGPELVGVQHDLAEDTYFAVDRFQLSFYRNMTIHLFISQALVSASIYTRVKAGGAMETQAIPYAALLDQVSFLSQLFRGEFIFNTAGLSSNLGETLSGLEADGVISVERKPSAPAFEISAAEAADTNNIISVSLSPHERTTGRENFDFYCFLVWPFIEAAWLGAVSLLMLTPPTVAQNETWLDMSTFAARAQLLGKTLYAQGDLSYFEAVNKETLKNAFQRFEEEGIILVRKPPKGASASQMIRLDDEWMPAGGKQGLDGRLWGFCEDISRCRLEGKNRRDGDAVVGRTLRLVGECARDLWESSVVTETGEEGQVGERSEKEKERRRRRQPMRSRASL